MTEQEIYISIRRLSPRQAQVFDRICVGDDSRIHPRTADALVKKGLVCERIETLRGGGFPCRIKRYFTPTNVHIVWCRLCAEEEEAKLP